MYPDTSILFDRTDSFVLTKEMLCGYLGDPYRYGICGKNPYYKKIDTDLYCCRSVIRSGCF